MCNRKVYCDFVQVTFVGEGAVDAGGPRREFFRLLASSAADSAGA